MKECNCNTDPHRYWCPRRKRSGKHAPRSVISFDCETVAGVGIVLFLACGSERAASYQYNAEGLSLDTLLDWIVRSGNGSLCFGFFFDYDVNQMVALLPDVHKAQLAARGRVIYRDWRINHVPNKRISVTNRVTGVSATIWDCSGWAQCSFAKLCDDWMLGSENERALVRAMKARRGEFENATREELVEYTTLECALLSEWVARLLQLHVDCGIHLRAYSGPGSTAGAMIRQRGWKPPLIPPTIERIASDAFFGGRSEISCIGPVPGPIYGYDINSAYPSEIAKLPDLTSAKWYKTKKWRPEMWGFYRVRWQQKRSACWGLFPVRGAMLPDGHRSVSLLYPTEGEGWFHSNEVAAAMELEANAVTILDGRVVEPVGAPFEWIRDGIQQRMEYKRLGDMRAFPLKVGYNSIYGKLAQHTGTHPLQCLAYAGAVTAATRGALLRAAYQHEHAVLLLATDGILTTEPLPECEIGSGLGQWEYLEYSDAWMLQAGVYWAGSKKRTRGIDARGLSLEDVDLFWKRRGTRAEIHLPTRRVLSYRLCKAQNKLPLTGQWIDTIRTVRFAPGPRRRSGRWEGDRLLTLPARLADYRAQAVLDQIALDCGDSAAYDDMDGLPDWTYAD